jgi:hypothetical protein
MSDTLVFIFLTSFLLIFTLIQEHTSCHEKSFDVSTRMPLSAVGAQQPQERYGTDIKSL